MPARYAAGRPAYSWRGSRATTRGPPTAQIWLSHRRGHTWSPPRVVSGDLAPCWNPVLHVQRVGPDPAVLQGRNQHLELADLCRRTRPTGADLVAPRPLLVATVAGAGRCGPHRSASPRGGCWPAPRPSSGARTRVGRLRRRQRRRRADLARSADIDSTATPRRAGDHPAHPLAVGRRTVHLLARSSVATWSPRPAADEGETWAAGAPEQRAQQQLWCQRLRGRRCGVPRPQPGLRGLGPPRPAGRLRQRRRRSHLAALAHPRAEPGWRAPTARLRTRRHGSA